eukprot:GHVP01006929.1.p2 GENE.GHVP01006929.1~~GHVP01006929.1.p2  ORF type:complete len:101 (+),score=18.42 GHVP01006929.1:139-441(+)
MVLQAVEETGLTIEKILSSKGLTRSIIVKEKDIEAIFDTGALPTVCGSNVAKKLDLQISDETRRLVGIGTAQAKLSRPAVIKVGDQTIVSQILEFAFLVN